MGASLGGFLFCCMLNGAQPRGAVLLDILALACEGERIRRDIGSDDGTGGHVSSISHGYGRDQSSIGTDEGSLADIGAVLCHPVVVADDRARTEIRSGPESRIPDIGQMIGLGTVLDNRFLDLHEI